MKKTLIVYCTEKEKDKLSNEAKVVLELEKLFASKGYLVQKLLLESKGKIRLRDQFKSEKEIILKKFPAKPLEYEFIIIGTPIVGSLTSSPLVNAFIRKLPKRKSESKKPFFALFSVGVVSSSLELRKLQSLLFMSGIKPVESAAFTSIFDFDAKKLIEVKHYFDRMMDKAY